jgi:2-oxoglutarate dehydrogenase E1 component
MVRGPLVEESANTLEGVNRLRAAYSGPIGYETDHIHNFEERTWIRESIESRRFFYEFDAMRKRELLERLTEVEVFERFLHQTFVGQKRFSLEGCDMLVPILDSIIRNAASGGSREMVIGMAHRGRLNVLAHILGKPYAAILAEF